MLHLKVYFLVLLIVNYLFSLEIQIFYQIFITKTYLILNQFEILCFQLMFNTF
jgi:hypothetical protein